jgi:hypothetical protein
MVQLDEGPNRQMETVSSAQKFCKTARCPSSETLLQYRRCYLTIVERMTIERHLRDCDFCSAEYHLLKRHRLEAEAAEVVEMPSHLQRLAVNLFCKTTELSRLGDLMMRSPLSH